MTTFLLFLFLTLRVAAAAPASLSWWFLPETSLELPHEIEEDDKGFWSEIWERSHGNPEDPPTGILERALGARWAGFNADHSGKPTRAVLILADRRVVDFDGEKARIGSLDGEKITWSDKSQQKIVEFKRKRKYRRRAKAVRMNFGKIALPPLTLKPREIPPWSMEHLAKLLEKLPQGPDAQITPRDLSAVAQIADPHGGILNMRFSPSCGFEERVKIENALAALEPQLTCWMEQNPNEGTRLLTALLQQPLIECRARAPMGGDACAMANIPFWGGFFVTQPRINLALGRCTADFEDTLLHEILHLAGIAETPEGLEKARLQSASCERSPARLNFESDSEGFMNDFQVGTRMFLFRKIKEEAVAKWGWTEGEKGFMLGILCAKMGDKYCARTYFQQAATGNLLGFIELPEGGEVTWSSLAQFNYFDSVTEELFRMHQLAQYLKRDPHGALLKRLETDNYRLHEFHIARSTLETIRGNKGVCNSAVDDKIYCEDLAALVKTPWFKNH